MTKNPLKILKKEFPELHKWLTPLCRLNLTLRDITEADYKEGKMRVRIYTKNYRYSIAARLPAPNLDGGENKNYGYLGCIVTTRKTRAGETWNRGNDLPDGKYNEKTWYKIENAILAYELVKVVKSN